MLVEKKESEFLTPSHRLMGRMDIYLVPGLKIRVVQKNYDYGFPNVEILKMGDIYTIASILVHDWHTDVYLVELPGLKFNSVCFEDYNE